MKRILLGITGSVAAYKSVDLISSLKKKGYAVDVCITSAALHFITRQTLENIAKTTIYSDVFEDDDPTIVRHIELAKNADLILICPASANTIAKIAHGLADDMLTSAILAGYDKKIIFAPAMNTKMYENPITQKNINILKDTLQAIEVEPKESLLACGDYGKGALANISDVIEVVEKVLK